MDAYEIFGWGTRNNGLYFGLIRIWIWILDQCLHFSSIERYSVLHIK